MGEGLKDKKKTWAKYLHTREIERESVACHACRVGGARVIPTPTLLTPSKEQKKHIKKNRKTTNTQGTTRKNRNMVRSQTNQRTTWPKTRRKKKKIFYMIFWIYVILFHDDTRNSFSWCWFHPAAQVECTECVKLTHFECYNPPKFFREPIVVLNIEAQCLHNR